MSGPGYELYVGDSWRASVMAPVPAVGERIALRSSDGPKALERVVVAGVEWFLAPIATEAKGALVLDDPPHVYCEPLPLPAPLRMLTGSERPPALWPINEPATVAELEEANYELHVGNQRFYVDVGYGWVDRERVFVADVEHEDPPGKTRLRSPTPEGALALAAAWAWVDPSEGGAPCAE